MTLVWSLVKLRLTAWFFVKIILDVKDRLQFLERGPRAIAVKSRVKTD